jgi:hypothetical protein
MTTARGIIAFGFGAIALGASCICQPTAAAELFDPVSGYASLGYSDVQAAHFSNGAIAGRLGARFGANLGVEGELSIGLDGADLVWGPPCSGPVCPSGPLIATRARLRDAEALYAVGFLPITPNADLFLRAGYGAEHYSLRSLDGVTAQSVNVGFGGDYFFDSCNGVRFDYTRHIRVGSNGAARELVGSGGGDWSAAYVFKF